jgi:hypothetical protein
MLPSAHSSARTPPPAPLGLRFSTLCTLRHLFAVEQLAKWQPSADNKDPDAKELQELETRTSEFLVRGVVRW